MDGARRRDDGPISRAERMHPQARRRRGILRGAIATKHASQVMLIMCGLTQEHLHDERSVFPVEAVDPRHVIEAVELVGVHRCDPLPTVFQIWPPV